MRSPSRTRAGVARYSRTRIALALDVFRALGRRSLLAPGLVVLTVGLEAIFLFPEVSIAAPPLNDSVLQALVVDAASDAIRDGRNPTDPWLESIGLGYPLLHHYQHLPQLVTAGVGILTLAGPTGALLVTWTTFALLLAFPVSVYWSMRRLGFNKLSSASSAFLAPWISTDNLFGFALNSYVWAGLGVYTQLWAMVLLPPTIAQCHRVLVRGGGFFWATALLAATLLSHLVYGYVALLAIGLLAGVSIISTEDQRVSQAASRIGLRFLALLALVGAVAGYFVIPFLTDRLFLNRSVWESDWKYDSFGAGVVLDNLVSGDLFDFGRFPAFTILVGLGLTATLWHWSDRRFRSPLVLFVFFLLLYFGRATWGPLLGLLPFNQEMHFHRMIGPVHLAGIMLAGVGVAFAWDQLRAYRNGRYALVLPVAFAVLAVGIVIERQDYLGERHELMQVTQDAFEAESVDLESMLDLLERLPPGRVYAGLPGAWGRDYQIGIIPMYVHLNARGFDMLGFLFHALALNGDIQVLFDDGVFEHYDLFNVKYVVAPSDRSFPDFVKPLQRFGRHTVYHVNTSGYAELVSSTRSTQVSKNDFFGVASAWLANDIASGVWHPEIELQSSSGSTSRLPTPSQADSRSATVLDQRASAGRFSARVSVDDARTLLFKTSFHPGWRAVINGENVEPVMLMPSYVGVRVPKGESEVVIEYVAEGSRAWLMLAGWGVLLALVFRSQLASASVLFRGWVGRLINER